MDAEESYTTAETYFMDRPIALSVAAYLADYDKGKTATELAFEFHVSVPTMYRVMNEMWRYRLLTPSRNGRRVEYQLSDDLKKALPAFMSKMKPPSRGVVAADRKLGMMSELMRDYRLSLGPQTAYLLVKSSIKQQVMANLPVGVRQRRLGALRNKFGEPVRFDLFYGTDEKSVAVDLKIIESTRHLRERLGMLASMGDLRKSGLNGIVVAYLITSMGDQWLVDEKSATEALGSLNRGTLPITTVIRTAAQPDLVNPSFLKAFATSIAKSVVEVVSNE
ncbi:MAG: hypothetical protein KGI38_05985 [Thaumarchaeota archaeon]|nr:hypothetical protein [Nitrososphaerota archaeon]